MQTLVSRQNRLLALAGTLAVLIIGAIAFPLYLSGTPNLRPNQAAPQATIPTAASNPTQSPATAVVSATSTMAAASVRTPVPNDPVLAAEIDALIGDKEGVYGIIVADPAEGDRYSSNADVPFLAASLYKLVLLADIYTGIEDGVIAPDAEITLLSEYFPGPDEPEDSYYTADSADSTVLLDEVLFATGAYSSNVAAHALLALTDDADLETMARDLGMTHTHFHVDPVELDEWPPADVTNAEPGALAEAVAFAEEQALDGPLMLTTPRDMEAYFSRLLAGEVVNEAVSELIVDTLKEQAVDDRFPCLLPFGTEMAHKTGNLDHVVHDVGVIWGPDGPVILIAMIEDPADDAEATLVIQRLAMLAYGDDAIPSIADAFASPEISCGIVAPTGDEPPADEFTEEVPVEEDASA